MANMNQYQERLKLVEDTIALKPVSRVANCTRVNYWPYYEYGLSIADSMRDFEKANECFYRYHREFSPDVGSMCACSFPSKVFEIAGMKNVRWPGDPKGLDVNAPYQYIEYETLGEDEYDEYLSTPIQFVLDKFLPRVADIYEPLRQLDYAMIATGIRTHLDAFTSPAMLEMYDKLKVCAELIKEYKGYAAEEKKTIMDMGYPFISGGGSSTAFDMLGDSMRGTFGIMPDLILQPENVKRTLDKFVTMHISQSLAQCKATNGKFAWVMLHKGFDNFISDQVYAEFYWPYLRQWIYAMIEHDITPVVFTEGSYTTRLKYLSDVPKGKVVYHFEEVDMKEAARCLGGKACVMGGFPATLLEMGTPEKVRDKAKEILDIMMPSGGYLFGISCSVDHAPRANMEMLFETVEQCGKY